MNRLRCEPPTRFATREGKLGPVLELIQLSSTLSGWTNFLRCITYMSHTFTLPLAMDTAAAPIPFLLLFRNSGPETHVHLSPEQRQQLMVRWNAWYDRLAAEGKATEGQPLELETRTVSGAKGERVTDGPFVEAKEAVGGYVKILASSLEEATEIAQRHPGLQYGLIIEIRQMAYSCHLGVTAGNPSLAGRS